MEVGLSLPAKAGVPAAMKRRIKPAASLCAPTFNHSRYPGNGSQRRSPCARRHGVCWVWPQKESGRFARNRPPQITARMDYLLSVFFGWHFSQTLPSSAAFWQHLCSHFLPASTVASQHGFLSSIARATLGPATNASAQRSVLTMAIFFIFIPFCCFPRLLIHQLPVGLAQTSSLTLMPIREKGSKNVGATFAQKQSQRRQEAELAPRHPSIIAANKEGKMALPVARAPSRLRRRLLQ